MGLFDKMLGGQGSQDVAFSLQEGVAGVLLTMVAADGHVSDEEAEELIAITNRMRVFSGQSAGEFNAMIDHLVGQLRKHGFESLLDRACRAIPDELRETVFAQAADLAFADGSVEEDERLLLEELQQQLGVPDQRALQIVQVLQIKNRG